MVPGLTLSYSSQGGGGIVGIGFSLAGLPSITRCPQTIAQDNVHGSVNYSSSDRFCLQGSRLILVSAGSYGADGTEYRTEVETFSKIIAHGTAGAGPAWFEVHTKAGQIMEFGNSTDSRIIFVDASTGAPSTTGTARAWGVDKVSDVVGNYYTITYNCAAVSGSCTDTSRTARGEAYPLRIDYTGNAAAGVSPYNSVQFSYTSRSDTQPMYQAGSVTQPTALLTDIKTYQSSNLVLDYKFSYRAGSASTSSRLTSLSLCDNGSPQRCLAPTTFGWQGGTGTLSMNTQAMAISATQGKYLVAADFNNDGLLDLAPVAPTGCPPYNIYLGTPTNGIGATPTPPPITTPVDTASSCTVSTPAYSLTSPNGLPYTFISISATYPGPTTVSNGLMIMGFAGNFQVQNNPFSGPSVAGDFNGDGYIDFFQQGNPTSYAYWGNGGGTFTPDGGHSGVSSSNSQAVGADFDGDGCTDILSVGNTGSNSVIFFCNPAVSSVSAPSTPTGDNIVLGDFNGDGKTDILFTNATGAGQLYFSTGTGFALSSCAIPSGWGNYNISVGNWNGDGKADLLLTPKIGSSPGTAYLWVSTGSCFVQAVDGNNIPITFQTQSASPNAVVADWNNDGASDIWLQENTGDRVFTFNYAPELMTSVSNGIGATTNVSYDRINKNGAFYTKGTSATFPTVDIDGAFYVVSRVDTSNGLGTCAAPNSYTYCYSTTYAYAGAQTDVHGRGFLGFSSIAATDLQTNMQTTTTYSLTFPYIGLVTSQISKYLPNTHYLTSVTNSYGYNAGTSGCGVSPAAGVYFVCLKEVDTAGYDLNDTAALPSTTTTFTYDAYGNALTTDLSVSDGSSKNTTDIYNNDTTNWFLGQLLSTSVSSVVGSSSLTRQSSFAYDATTGLLTQESIEPGVSTCNSGADPCTLTTAYTYDAFGHRVTSEVYGTGITTRMTYAGYDSIGQFQTYAMNALGQAETWTHDVRFGEPLTHTGPNGLTTSWTYDTFGRMTLQVQPDGTRAAASYTYCAGACPTLGAFLAQTETFAANGSTQIGPLSTAYYDMLSRAIATDTQGFDGSNERVATIYDARGHVFQSSRPYFTASGTPLYSTFSYDALGRVTQSVAPNSAATTNVFNGLTISVTNNLGQTTSTTKNAQGLNASVQDAAGKTMSYVYDAFGDLLTTTDPAGNVISLSYDIRGNKYESVDPDMGTWTYSYDVLGQLGSQADAKSQNATISYDVLGRPTIRSESGLYSTWTYGTSVANHNVGQLIEAKACTSSGCSTVVSDRTFAFDSLGRPSTNSLQTAGGNFGYGNSYDPTSGKLATTRYPSGFVLGNSYNAYGYLCVLAQDTSSFGCTPPGGTNVIEKVNARDAEGHLTQFTAGKVVTNQTYDPATGLPTGTRAGTGGSVASFDYSFDSIGNLVSRTDNNENFTEGFCYDTVNRLTNYGQAPIGGNTWNTQWGTLVWGALCGGTSGSSHWLSVNWGGFSWGACTAPSCKTVSYDAAGLGNITGKSDVGSYSYPSAGSALPHAVSSITGVVDGLTNPLYSYDANGNLTCVSTGSGCTGTVGRQVSLTAFNMAATITEGSTTVAFAYDDQHQRIQQATTVSGATTTTTYLNDPASGASSQQVVVGSGAPGFTDYVKLDGNIVGQRTVAFVSGTWGSANWGTLQWGAVVSGSDWGAHNWGSFSWGGAATVTWGFFTLDHLGSIAVIADANGLVVQRLSYDAWGKQRNANGTDASCGSITSSTTRGFTNQEQVPVACMVNLNARIYDPTLGKFMAPDPTISNPFDTQTYNRFAYVFNNPLSFTDPTGFNVCTADNGFCDPADSQDPMGAAAITALLNEPASVFGGGGFLVPFGPSDAQNPQAPNQIGYQNLQTGKYESFDGKTFDTLAGLQSYVDSGGNISSGGALNSGSDNDNSGGGTLSTATPAPETVIVSGKQLTESPNIDFSPIQQTDTLSQLFANGSGITPDLAKAIAKPLQTVAATSGVLPPLTALNSDGSSSLVAANFGFTAGGAFELGIGQCKGTCTTYSAGGQFSGYAAAFVDGNGNLSAGKGIVSGSYTGTSTGTPSTVQGSVGAYGGLGWGITFGNASSNSQLFGPFPTETFNSFFGSISYASAGGIWQISITGGPGCCGSISRYNTVTKPGFGSN